MLEVKDLYREYKPKKGEPVVALNHVSVKFPDKGLVFILGKSGSGKSTLLNVMGGLDKADGGDIIIKGKSSKNFKQGDFDSYRNTYLGFIFQEYNILDEFNVGQNIGLALELQGRKATSDEINRILEEVDLKGYGNRKTNELSGGQKQRVAIARALVKDPDIIFGDEPTGALDSKTGLAVFDTLKKLAQNKLVIVVSHDREFAELYGDRVIELADGKIISDIEKISVAGDKKSEGLTLIDQSVLKVEKDYELTDEDMALIKKYLNEKKNQERLISLDDSVNGAFKRITRIDDFGNKESFKTTDEAAIVNKQEEFKAIKSRLSLRKCFRIGGSSLKTKPFRLVITILLAITAFGMFGLADTMGSYNKVTSTTDSIMELANDSIAMEKVQYYKYSDTDDYVSSRKMYADDDDLNELKNKYGIDFKGVYRLNENGESSFYENIKNNNSDYYSSYPSYFSGLYLSNPADISRMGYTLIGSYPENDGEVAITKVMYETFKKNGYKDSSGKSIDPTAMTESNIIGKTLSYYSSNGQKSFKITGIVDTNFNRERYAALDKSEASDMASTIGYYMLANQFMSDYRYSFSSVLFTNQKTIDNIGLELKLEIDNGNITIDGYTNNFYRLYSIPSNALVIGNGNLSENQIGISYNTFRNNFNSNYSVPKFYALTGWYDKENEKYETNYYEIEYLGEAISYFSNYYELYNAFTAFKAKNDPKVAAYDTFDDYYNYLKELIFTDDAKNYLLNQVNNLPVSINASYRDIRYNSVQLFNNKQMTISAIVIDNSYSDSVYVNNSVIKSANADTGKYTFVLADMPSDSSLVKKMVTDTYADREDGTTIFRIQNGVMPAYESINDLIETLSQVFLYVGIGFAVFASLMLFNFITISISYKKREIGILRAVGARSRDVFNIFFAESFIIAMIAFTFAIVATFIISKVINNSLINEYNLMFTLLSPGIRQVLLVLAVSIGVAFISTFIPVYNIAMKRPIDAIRDR